MKLINRIRFWFEDKRELHYEKQLKKKYPDWNYDNWVGDLEFIWGVKSYTDLTGCDANMHTLNDIEIDYDHNEKRYLLSIETAYLFKDKKVECEYLKGLLKCFEEYMDEKKIEKDHSYNLFFSHPCLSFEADSIPELFTQFRLFVNGFVSLYE